MSGQWFAVPEICRIIDLLVNENKLTVPGLVIYFTFFGLMLFSMWFPDALLRAKRISFIQWLIIEHEKNNKTTKNIFISIRALGKKCRFENQDLILNPEFIPLLNENRKLEIYVALGFVFLWIALITFVLNPDSESQMLGNWILYLFGSD